jgi:xanthine dehydrogenase accessory factor
MNRWATIANVLKRGENCVLVSITATQGSVPRDTDAWMVVTADGFHGSIGGGTLEWKAMAEAQSMLGKHRGERVLDYVLGPDLGQCCGGRATVGFETFVKAQLNESEARARQEIELRRSIYLFGAGHVGRALVLALAPLPFTVKWIDPRPSAFPSLVPQNVSAMQPTEPVASLNHVPEGSLVYVMTHSHALDLEIVDAALRNPMVAHVGLIGSATKRVRFEKRLAEAGVDQKRIAELICPIGIAGIASKLPAAIASGVAAQALQLDSALSAQASQPARQTG